MSMILILLLNLLVGACIGLTGIAGFLLPMFYTGFLGMPAGESLALSFSAFLISGVLGSVTYYRQGNLDLKPAVILSAGSLPGALAGVWVNLLIPEDVMQMILYIVGACLGHLHPSPEGRENGWAGETDDRGRNEGGPVLPAGVATGAVCAASGAGGPVLVMPLLTLIGFPAHTAVGISLFNSVFIALPAAGGYLWSGAENTEMFLLLIPVLIAHGIGVAFGSRNAEKIDPTMLKRIVAAASIAIALIKLFLR